MNDRLIFSIILIVKLKIFLHVSNGYYKRLSFGVMAKAEAQVIIGMYNPCC